MKKMVDPCAVPNRSNTFPETNFAMVRLTPSAESTAAAKTESKPHSPMRTER